MCVRFGESDGCVCGCRDAVDRFAREAEEVAENLLRGQVQTSVEEVSRSRPSIAAASRGAVRAARKGPVAIFQELGKALTSSLQLIKFSTIMEKDYEFLRGRQTGRAAARRNHAKCTSNWR